MAQGDDQEKFKEPGKVDGQMELSGVFGNGGKVPDKLSLNTGPPELAGGNKEFEILGPASSTSEKRSGTPGLVVGIKKSERVEGRGEISGKIDDLLEELGWNDGKSSGGKPKSQGILGTRGFGTQTVNEGDELRDELREAKKGPAAATRGANGGEQTSKGRIEEGEESSGTKVGPAAASGGTNGDGQVNERGSQGRGCAVAGKGNDGQDSGAWDIILDAKGER